MQSDGRNYKIETINLSMPRLLFSLRPSDRKDVPSQSRLVKRISLHSQFINFPSFFRMFNETFHDEIRISLIFRLKERLLLLSFQVPRIDFVRVF